MGAYEAHRGGSGEPLVLVHGFSGTWRAWEPVLDRLEASHDVLAVTLLGHAGGPECSAGASVSMPMLVDAVERDMDAAGLDRKSTRLNSSHANISYAVFCLKK